MVQPVRVVLVSPVCAAQPLRFVRRWVYPMVVVPIQTRQMERLAARVLANPVLAQLLPT